ncbi:recombinase family protein [Kordiimonas sp. A6E486]|nr:recombinase family protein [Kordiimonas marina]
MRTAFYARYSTDLQSEASIEDQMRRLKARAQQEGWQIANSYSDAATSGASMMRPGIQRLMVDAADCKFDIVLCEALDRLSRNQSDIARIYEQLTFHGVTVITLSEGVVSELHIGLKGTMNALFLKDLADKTRRGLEGRVRAGKSGGGKAFGYDIPLKFDAAGEKVAGELIIHDEEAETVRRIFAMYADGMSPRKIAHTLNDEGVRGPQGGTWGPTTIHGNRRRGTGIINNELYIGRRVWNRLHYVKNPSTGKRVSRLNPEDQWIVEEAPDLRIVPDELWERAKARQKALDDIGTNFYDKSRPRYFWSGKVKCGCCGSSYIKISKDHLGCTASRAKGKTVCANRKTIRMDTLEEQLLASLQHHLMQPESFAEFIEAFSGELNRMQGEARGRRKALEGKITKIERQLDKAIDAIFDGAPASRFKERMEMREAEKADLKQELSMMDKEAPLLLHTGMADIYKQRVGKLADALHANREDLEAFNTMRSLLDTVTLHPTDKGFDIDLQGDLATILHLSAAGNKPLDTTTKPSEFDLGGSGALAEQVKMVAGAGFEPATFRL